MAKMPMSGMGKMPGGMTKKMGMSAVASGNNSNKQNYPKKGKTSAKGGKK